MGTDHVIPELSLRALRGADPFTVFGPEQERAFCHVGDAVDAVLRLVATPAAHGAIVNVGNDKEVTRISDLAALILELANLRPRLDPRPAPAGSVARRCPDLERLRRLTGVQPRIPLEDGVRATFEWYRAWLAAGGGA
jgi:UDP-glucose 4-epimerase/UDP-glucuronate decarboxylase